MLKIVRKIFEKSDKRALKNNFWALSGSIIQNVLLSLFFVFIARHYSQENFATFIISNSLYQFVVVFSSMGLGQWFIRDLVNTKNKNRLMNQFLQMQFLLGIAFFIINIILAVVIYNDSNIRLLSFILGINIIFDNFIYVIKNVNIAEFEQKRTSKILVIQALGKVIIGGLLFVFPFSIFILSVAILIIRIFTFSLFLKLGLSSDYKIGSLWKKSISIVDFKSLIIQNWVFVVIGSTYVIYWRLSTLIISKTLPQTDVAHYEISYKLFSLAQLIPVIAAGTIFPKFVKLFKDGNIEIMKLEYEKLFKLSMIYGLVAYTFIFSFGDYFIPLAFGEKYLETATYAKQMFLVTLVFPTSFLQAKLLVAMKLEKLDMWFNLNSILINVTLSLTLLYFYKSLAVINYSIFFSFIVFHLCQDYVLYRRRIITLKNISYFLLLSIFLVYSYTILSSGYHPILFFVGFWFIISVLYLIKIKIIDRINSK